MKKLFALPMLCFCLLLSACGAGQSSSPEQSMPQEAHANIPLSKDSPKFYIKVENPTAMQGDMKGTIMALLQSEYGAREAESALQADYIIAVTINYFGQQGTEVESASTMDMALPGLAGAGLGAQIGGSFSGKGTLIGAGIGLVAGIALGSAAGSEEVMVWKCEVQVTITDPAGKEHISKLAPEVRGQDMSISNASMSLENTVSWSIVRKFKKVNS